MQRPLPARCTPSRNIQITAMMAVSYINDWCQVGSTERMHPSEGYSYFAVRSIYCSFSKTYIQPKSHLRLLFETAGPFVFRRGDGTKTLCLSPRLLWSRFALDSCAHVPTFTTISSVRPRSGLSVYAVPALSFSSRKENGTVISICFAVSIPCFRVCCESRARTRL